MSGDTDVVRVAAVQLAPQVGDLDGNRSRSVAAIEAAADAGADVVVLPELASSGYVFESRAEAADLAQTRSGATVAAWLDVSSRRGVVVVAGFCELGDDGELYNAAAVLEAGRLHAVYRKAHLWDREKAVFAAGGSPPPVVRTRRCAIGVAICYDVEFPELTRGLALRGADLLAIPMSSPDLGDRRTPYPMEVVVTMATAHLNRVFVAVADRCGVERGVDWVGGTVVVGPDGWLLAGPPAERVPELVVADCDVRRSRDKSWGAANDLFGDRRPALYGVGVVDLGDTGEER